MTISLGGASGDGDDDERADPFFSRARAIADDGQFEFAIEMFIQGLGIAPHRVSAHKELRNVSLRRKVAGGKAMSILAAMKFKRPSKDYKQNLLNAEKLLAYDPGNRDHMLALLQSAAKAGLDDVVAWVAPLLRKATDESC
jgi:tetratricopeptide (TPR) repeat protein